MNLITKIQNVWPKLMAQQLRRPSGLLARLTGNKMNKANESLYRLTFNNLNLKEGDSILEIGFGNGKFFSELNTKAKHLNISGIEHSKEMVDEAIRKNLPLLESGVLKVSVGSSDNLPFDDNSFDKIYCINVIYFWENPNLHLREIHRVLKPGGIFCTGFRPKENLSKFPFTNFGFTLYSGGEWKSILEENGFQYVKSDLEKLEGSPFESLCMVSTR